MRIAFLCLAGSLLAKSGWAQSWANKGTWVAPYNWGICAIHMTLMPDQSLLVWNWNRDRPLHNLFAVKVITSTPGTYNYANVNNVPFPFAPLHDHELFCAGHTLLADGRLFAAGGHILSNIGIDKTKIFDFNNWAWLPTSNLTAYPDPGLSSWNGRWYPTTISLPNGDFAILSGARDVLNAKEVVSGPVVSNDYPELWTPPVSILGDVISRMFDATMGLPINRVLNRNYPHAFIHPGSGKLIVLGSATSGDEGSTGGTNHIADLQTLNWETAYPHSNADGPGDDVPSTKVDYPSAVMIDGIIVRSGGSAHGAEGLESDPDPANRAVPATANAMLLKLTDDHLPGIEKEVWYKAPTSGATAGKMVYARKNHTLTALPDGKILAMGGCLKRNNPVGNWIAGATERTFPEMWDPLNPTAPWTLLAGPASQHRIGRPYHSTALLLPDARVIIAGGELEFINGTLNDAQRTMQFFAPPYGGVEEATWRPQQPIITSENKYLSYGKPFTLTVSTPVQGRRIKSISLISLGSTTHAFNANQQFVFLHKPENGLLEFGNIALTAPLSTFNARPGYYMLFVVDEAGVPSNGKIIRLKDFEPFGIVKATITPGKGTSEGGLVANDIRLAENKYLGGNIECNAGLQTEIIVDAVGDFDRVTGIRAQVEVRRAPHTAFVLLDASIYNYQTAAWVQLGSSTIVNGTERILNFTHPSSTFAATSAYCTNWFDPVQAKVRLRFTGFEPYSVKIDAVRLGFTQEE